MTLMFTDRVRKVFRLALENASRLNLEYISTDHLLLGIIEEGNSIAVQVLKNLRVDILEMQRALLLKTERGSSFTTSVGNLPQTPRVKRVVEGAIQLAGVMKHSHVGCYHLLAVLASQDCHTGKVLGDFGVTNIRVIEEITRIVQSSSPDDAVKLSITSVGYTKGNLSWLDDTPSPGHISGPVPEAKKEINHAKLMERYACIGEIQQEMEEAKVKGDMTLACSLLRIIKKLTPQWEGEAQEPLEEPLKILAREMTAKPFYFDKHGFEVREWEGWLKLSKAPTTNGHSESLVEQIKSLGCFPEVPKGFIRESFSATFFKDGTEIGWRIKDVQAHKS